MQEGKRQIHLPRGQVRLPKVQIRLPKVQIRLPKVQVRLPKVQVRLPKVQIHLPKVQIHLPEVQIHLPKVQVRLPKVQIHLPKVQIHARMPLHAKARVAQTLLSVLHTKSDFFTILTTATPSAARARPDSRSPHRSARKGPRLRRLPRDTASSVRTFCRGRATW